MFRLFAILFLAAGFWIGLKAERFFTERRCYEAGGEVGDRGICLGVMSQ